MPFNVPMIVMIVSVMMAMMVMMMMGKKVERPVEVLDKLVGDFFRRGSIDSMISCIFSMI